MGKKKRAQITIFIILGIIIVISMGLLFAANIKDEFSAPLQDIIVKEYVSDCLEKVADKGLELIGKQGGVLYQGQIEKGFPKFDYGMFTIPYNENNVSYGIKSQGYGIYMLKPLCNKEGENKWDLNILKYSCETYDIFNTGNIQDYLREYINKSIKECDLSSLEAKYGYKIDKGNVKTNILIGDDDLKIDLEYELTVKGKESKTELLKFGYTPKIRLKKIHELASHLIGFDSLEEVNPLVGDIYDVDFHIEEHAGSNKLRCKSDTGSCLQGMQVKKIKNVYEHDDILQIIDSKSLLYGKSYIFQFAIENRIPYLEVIGNTNINVGDKLELKLIFHDPDEDTASYSSSGCNDVLENKKFQGSKFIAERISSSGCDLTITACDDGNLCYSKKIEIQ